MLICCDSLIKTANAPTTLFASDKGKAYEGWVAPRGDSGHQAWRTGPDPAPQGNTQQPRQGEVHIYWNGISLLKNHVRILFFKGDYFWSYLFGSTELKQWFASEVEIEEEDLRTVQKCKYRLFALVTLWAERGMGPCHAPSRAGDGTTEEGRRAEGLALSTAMWQPEENASFLLVLDEEAHGRPKDAFFSSKVLIPGAEWLPFLLFCVVWDMISLRWVLYQWRNQCIILLWFLQRTIQITLKGPLLVGHSRGRERVVDLGLASIV